MLETLLPLVLGAFAGMWIQRLRGRAAAADPSSPGEPAPPPGSADAAAAEVLPLTPEALAAAPPDAVRDRLGAALDEAVAPLRHPDQHLELPLFALARAALDPKRFPDALLADWVVAARPGLGLAAAGASMDRDPVRGEALLFTALGSYTPWGRYVLLRLLDEHHPPSEAWLLPLLARLDETWLEEQNLRVLREWAGRRQAAEEPPSDDVLREWLESQPDAVRPWILRLLAAIGPEVGRPWREALERTSSAGSRVRAHGPPTPPVTLHSEGEDPLTACGRLWTREDAKKIALGVPDPDRDALAERILRLLLQPTPPPLVVVGLPRSGKSTLIRAVVHRLLGDRWVVLEATPDQVNAGMTMVGQLESRVERLARATRPGEGVLWYVPDVTGLAWAGSVSGDAGRSIGRVLRRALEERSVVVLGECSRAEWEHSRVQAPWLTSCFETIDVPVPDESRTRELVELWLRRRAVPGAPPPLDAGLVREAWELTRQFLAEGQRPGNLFDTVRLALEDRDAANEGAPTAPLTRDDLLRSVSRRTGLPLALLDDRQALDVDEVQSFFNQRVRGQQEAVECLVDRLAMIKSGVTDPTRPLGVFLFAGPTGSGKTELAKTLADYLFGSPARMIRLDMSELRTADSLDKLLGSAMPERGAGASLIERVRQEPFSVILLDEFEKAAPEVWDLFLQVFDDGRLGDRRGRVADFRHCVILLTSNVGARIETRAGVGFRSEAVRFSQARVHEALRSTFRPEFLNRIDRVVVFHPLSRDTMREILLHQIEKVSSRRGLRDRPWAVEFDDAALELLLERGFSPDLGARPLQRALERHLLAPLARTMASQRAPAGDQFLFVRAVDGDLAIDFVDPDAPVPAGTPASEGATDAGLGDRALLARIALEPRGLASELIEVDECLRTLEQRLEESDWLRRREAELEMTSLEDFWQAEDRFVVLDQFQTRERIERVTRSTRRLLERLRRPGHDYVPVGPLQELAMKVHLLRAAVGDLDRGHPGEVLLLVHDRGPTHDRGRASRRVGTLASMYRGWATRRGASLQEIEAGSGGWAATVQGFGVVSLLVPEAGLHVFEEPGEDERRLVRATLRVHAEPVEPSDPRLDTSATRLRALLDEPDDFAAIGVVRRYRERPSPLARDAVRGWRTGRIDRVLAGDFDLIPTESTATEVGEG